MLNVLCLCVYQLAILAASDCKCSAYVRRSQNEVDQLYAYMKQFVASTEADIQWRLARAACDKAKSSTDKNQRKDLMYEAFAAAERALQFGDKNFACHKVCLH